MRLHPHFLLPAIAIALSIHSSSRADDFYIWAEEAGGNVVFFWQGSIDLTGVSPGGTFSSATNIKPLSGEFFATTGTFDYYQNFVPNGNLRSFGTGAFATAPTSISGDTFVMDAANLMGLPNGYVSGNSISGTMTFAGETFTSLEVSPDSPFTFLTTGGRNTIHMFSRPPAAPATSNAAAQQALTKKIQKLLKKSKKLKKKGKKKKAKKLLKKVKKLKVRLLLL